ncbi:MAG: hypothetical protein JSW23_02970, partial [Planctomycetota bacterium]
MSKKLFLLTCFVLVLALANSLFSQPETWPVAYWSGFGDDPCSWDDANNWWTVEAYWDDVNYPDVPGRIWAKAPNSVPDANTVVMVGQGSADYEGNANYEYPTELATAGAIGYPVIDSNTTAVCYEINISTGPNDTNGPGRLDMTGGSLTSIVYSDDWEGITIGWISGGRGSMTVTDGIVNLTNYDGEGGNLNIGGYGTGLGTLTQLGGEIYCYHLDCTDADTSEGHLNLY